MEELEIWKNIKGYEGHYEVSNYGRVRSICRKCNIRNGVRTVRGRTLKLRVAVDGYMLCGLWLSKYQKTIKVHQVVAIAFLNHIPNGHTMVVDHIDGDKTNNNISNLRIVTHRENSSGCYRKDRESMTSKFTGVFWYEPTKKWVSHIRINKKNKHLGCFLSEQEASDAYQLALSKL